MKSFFCLLLTIFNLSAYAQSQNILFYDEFGRLLPYPNIQQYSSNNAEKTWGDYIRSDSLLSLPKNVSHKLRIEYFGRKIEIEIELPKDSIITLPLYSQSIFEEGEPKQIITAEELALSGKNTLEEALVYLLPSFYAAWQIMADKSEFLTPTSLKGMGPDQFLVLINGKRRHSSAMLHANGTFGRGTVSHDLVNIPMGAVQEIEIKSAAASVWHGSDAIAGIINIKLNAPETQSSLQLREKPEMTLGFTAGYYADNGFGLNRWWKGQSYEHEREGKIYFNTFHQFGKNKEAFLNLSGEMLHLGHLNRSGDYTGDVYKKGDAATVARTDRFWEDTDYQGNKVLMTGRTQIQQTAAYFNAQTPILINTSEKMFLYAFGGTTYKKGDVVGFNRFPKDSAKVNTIITPTGYQPHLEPSISDFFITLGLKLNLNIGSFSLGKLDVAQSTGSSSIGNQLLNSFNADLGVNSPRNFDAGGNYYRQATTDIQLEKRQPLFENNLKRHQLLHIRTGMTRRKETFGITAGDEASYYYNNVVDATEGGSQKLVGFDKDNQIERSRENYGIFAQIKYSVQQKNWLGHLTIGGRSETFNDANRGIIGKMSGALNYSNENISVETRSSVNQGFRTPSLHQLYFTGISSQYRGATPHLVYIASNSSLLAQDFGVKTLLPEKTTSFNVGFTVQNKQDANFNSQLASWELKADYSQTSVKDRIILSGFFDINKGNVAATLFNRIPTLKYRSVSSALFFINYPDSKTHNVDASFTYKTGTKLNFQVGFNWHQTIVSTDTHKLSPQLRVLEPNFFGREERSRYKQVIPEGKGFISVYGVIQDWNYKVQGTLFGQNAYIHPVDSSSVFDQIFKNQYLPIFDLELGYTFKNSKPRKGQIKLTGGIQNLLGYKSNKIQDWKEIRNLTGNDNKRQEWENDVTTNGALQYSRRVQTFGVGGTFLYVKMSYEMGQKVKK